MARFRPSNILGDPFALATISIAVVAWLITFVTFIVASIQVDYPQYQWWTIAYMLCIIAGVIAVVGTDTATLYGVAVSTLADFLGETDDTAGGIPLCRAGMHHVGRQYHGV